MLGDHQMAVRACLRSHNYVGAADSCGHEAETLTGEAAQAKLQDAIKYHRKAKQPVKGFQLLKKHPHLAQSVPAEVHLHCYAPMCVLYIRSTPLLIVFADVWDT